MKVIFGTAPLPIASRLPNGTTAPGLLRFEARVYASGEDEGWGDKTTVPRATAIDWLRQVTGRDKVVVAPPPPALNAPPVEIPAAVLRALPADTQVGMEWFWVRTK